MIINYMYTSADFYSAGSLYKDGYKRNKLK